MSQALHYGEYAFFLTPKMTQLLKISKNVCFFRKCLPEIFFYSDNLLTLRLEK